MLIGARFTGQPTTPHLDQAKLLAGGGGGVDTPLLANPVNEHRSGLRVVHERERREEGVGAVDVHHKVGKLDRHLVADVSPADVARRVDAEKPIRVTHHHCHAGVTGGGQERGRGVKTTVLRRKLPPVIDSGRECLANHTCAAYHR